MDKLQRAGRDFLMRLVAKHGLAGAAWMLRTLADELEAFACAQDIKPISKQGQPNPACRRALKDS